MGLQRYRAEDLVQFGKMVLVKIGFPEKAKTRLEEAVDTTRKCGNHLMYLPGQKEQETRKKYLAHGIPLTPERVDRLRRVAADKRVEILFDLKEV